MSSDTASTNGLKKVALVIGSTRKPRLGPNLAQFIRDTLESSDAPSSSSAEVQLEVLDVADFGLPVFDEPGIPMMIKASDGYAHEHTRAWSRAVSRYAGFVFLTPQYNWSVPAALKNAMDYLFHEWAGKPCAILSYGGRGGGKGADHLRDIVQAFRMKLVAEPVGFALGPHEGASQAGVQGTLWDGASIAWAAELEKAKESYALLCKEL